MLSSLVAILQRGSKRSHDTSEGPASTPGVDPGERLDTTTWTDELLNALEWRRFEQLCAAYFQALNFRVEETGFGDGAVDLRLFREGLPHPVIVKCKAWKWRVGVTEVEELRELMAIEGARQAIFMTTSKFAKDATDFAQGKGVTLIDGAGLLDKLRRLPAEQQAAMLKEVTSGDFRTPSCPSCGIKMRLKHGRESFWGCATFPDCSATMRFASQAAM